MVGRTKIGKCYVVRDKFGRFRKWTPIGKSLRRDRLKRAKRVNGPGQGHRGDYYKWQF